MPDNLTPEDRQKTMRAVRGTGTGLERQLFSMLAGMRLKGWRKNAKDVLGKPDVAFDGTVAIFVDGCFWHGCPLCKRPLPQTNLQYWKRKIGRNVKRASLNTRSLKEQGWAVIRIWEHEMRDPNARRRIRNRLLRALQKEAKKHASRIG
ncbi:MAG: very short patch repair endonuclease [Chloroflexi bacterium]|nr:very short patch repair endonuclease [Chloroflexota bacterium]